MRKLLILFCLAIAQMTAGATSILTEWNPVILNALIANNPAPTPATHILSSVYDAAYEAWAAYDATATGLYTGNRFDLPSATDEVRAEAISYAIFTVLNAFAPVMPAERNAFMDSKGYNLSASSPTALLGVAIAQAVIQARGSDGSNQPGGYADYTGYQPRPSSIPGAWQPLLVNGIAQKPLTPHWGLVKPFAALNGRMFTPPPPAVPGSQRWNEQIQQIIDLSAGLTDRHKVIAEFWRPRRGSPPMHLAEMTAQFSLLKGYGLGEDARLFHAIHQAMFDAGIVCWAAKYEFDYVRPITAIRGLGEAMVNAWGGPNQGTRSIRAADWQPYQKASDPTPPFPEYVSGHSAFSAAWAEVMRSFTGADYFGGWAEISELEIEDGFFFPPIRLEWPSFTAAAEESGMSRLYGSIHFMDANRQGQTIGTLVGKTVWMKCAALYDGRDQTLSDPRCDINSDGAVDSKDLLLLRMDWQRKAQ